MQKHPYKNTDHVCNIYCVSETTPFIWPAEKRFEFMMTPKQIIFGRYLSEHIQELKYLAESEQPPLHFTVNVLYGKEKKIKFFVHWLVSLAQAVTTVSHSMFLIPHFGTPPHRWSCKWVGELTALLAKLPFWLDIVWTLTQCREFCVHLTSLINKSSVAK